jgi:beta-N-acetylhexosaminidase
MPTAFITGVSGPVLSPDERAFLQDADPWGLILFKRNVEGAEQLAALTADFRSVVGRSDAPVLVDQEGGRVQRLGPPLWPAYPPGAAYGSLYDLNPEQGLAAAQLGARLIAAELRAVGITVDCLPLADVPAAGAHEVIGDRAYGRDPEKVSRIARAVATGLVEGGVLPVLKHLPGHGRAGVDSHERLPVVEASAQELRATDFTPFRQLADLPLGMTAHVVYTAFDAQETATTSTRVISEIIRDWIGFDGALMSDDLSMRALGGSMRERTRAALSAGCDLVLHCNGQMEEMLDVAREAPTLAGQAERRTSAALAGHKTAVAIDLAEARLSFSTMMRPVWPQGDSVRIA